MKITHTENMNGKIVAKGKLILVPIKGEDAFNDPNIKNYVISGELGGRLHRNIPNFGLGNYHKPIIISETEEIKKHEDKILYKDKILKVSKNRGLYLSVYEFSEIDIRTDLTKKIIALPEQLSPKTIQDIIEGKIKNGDEIYLECETFPVNNLGNEITIASEDLKTFRFDGREIIIKDGRDIVKSCGLKRIKLTPDGYITLVEKQKVVDCWDDVISKSGVSSSDYYFTRLVTYLKENYNPPTKK